MQTSSNRSNFLGVGLAGVAVLAAISVLSCQPGVLDCGPNNDCVATFGASSNGSTDGGTTAGMGGSSGSAAVNLNTPLVGCAKYTTVGAMETMFMVKTCGTNVACHVKNGAFPPDMTSANIYTRLLNVATVTNCKPLGDKYIDSSKGGAGSMLVQKVSGDMPKCADGKTTAMARRPFGAAALAADDINCVKAYAIAVAGK